MKVFSTYDPAYLLRNPSAGSAVEGHLRMLERALDGRALYEIDASTLEYETNPLPPGPGYDFGKFVCLDIETYGIIEGYTQTQWQPLKSEVYDKVRPDEMVQSVALSWRSNGRLHSAIFYRDASWDRLWGWLRRIRESKSILLGQNFCFDLGYLRYALPVSRAWLCPPLAIADLSITNYLANEVRPEKSLKNLAPLLGVTKYEPGFRQYKSSADPELHRYNVQDTQATLLANEKLWEAITSYYGPSSAKLSAYNEAWYNDLLWLVLHMTENGVSMNVPSLQELYGRYNKRRSNIVSLAKDLWSMPLRGEGSDRAKREVMDLGVESIREGTDIELRLTDKRKEVSFCDENRNKLLGVLPRTSEAAKKLRAIGVYADTAKIMDAYLRTLLVGGKGGLDVSTKEINGIVYPRWYPVPSQFDDGGTGGTVQSRIVCRGPGVQTFPHIIKDRISCRFPGGRLLWFDLSQIELRVAALLSGDPRMLEEYANGIDRHSETAKMIFSPGIVTHHQFKKLYRQAGKTLNFLVLFRGGAKKFQETLVRDIGLFLDVPECRNAIEGMRMKYPRLWQWQDELIEEAKSKGFLELPLIGQSRLYLGGEKAVEAAMNEIVNQPVQTTAANGMISIQTRLLHRFTARGLRSLSTLNIYDAAPIEVYPGEEEAVIQCLEESVRECPYFHALFRELGRSVPITYAWHWA